MKQALLILIPVVIIAILLNMLSAILLPFIVAIAVAYLMDPMVERLVQWKVNRTIAALIPSFVFIVIFAALVVFVLPTLVEDAIAFSHKIPTYLKDLEVSLIPILEEKTKPFLNLSKEDLLDYLYNYGDHTAMVAITIFRKIASSTSAFFDVASLLLITPIVVFYLIRDWPKAVHSFENMLPKKYKKNTLKTMQEMDIALSTFLRGQFNVSLILGGFYGCGLWLIGLEMGFVIGFLTGLFSFVPYIGMLIGCITAFAVALIQFQLGDYTPYIYIGGVFIAGQILESMVLQPKIIGDKTGLHPVWVIFALMAGGQLGGFLGILIALPLATIMVVLTPKMITLWQKSIANE
jgi:predicted PurR-regulated permease PerM